jgi:hypothetical protein
MGIRRERPPVERSDNSIKLHFPDGTVKTVPLKDVRASSAARRCCFCGEDLDGERIELFARWVDDGQERMQAWGAHPTCLAERMHGSVAGLGPFFEAEPG